MPHFVLLTSLFLLNLFCVLANVEKTVFLGPERSGVQLSAPEGVAVSKLPFLSASKTSLRSQIRSQLPSSQGYPKRATAWFILSDLKPFTRHELRVCWSATQPTAFELSLHDLGLALHSEVTRLSIERSAESNSHVAINHDGHLMTDKHHDLVLPASLLLRVVATADYFTTNQTLMRDGLPVDFDIILDRYWLNVLPRSLLPTAVYLTVLAIFSWHLSAYVWRALLAVARDEAAVSEATQRPQQKPKRH